MAEEMATMDGMMGGGHAQQQRPTVPSAFHEPPASLPAPTRRDIHSTAFLPPNYQQYFHVRSMMTHTQMPAGSDALKEVPKAFNCIFPLDKPAADGSLGGHAGSYSYPTKVFKVVRQSDGIVFALRRVDKIRTTPQITQVVTKAWERVHNVGIVPLREIFVQSGALFFLHDFMPGAKTVKERYLDQ